MYDDWYSMALSLPTRHRIRDSKARAERKYQAHLEIVMALIMGVIGATLYSVLYWIL